LKKNDLTDKKQNPSTPSAGSGSKAMNIVVTLADNAVTDAWKISHKLKKSGMTIETQLDDIGQYIGTSSCTDITRLAAIEGVAAVEQLGEVHLPPSPLDPQ